MASTTYSYSIYGCHDSNHVRIDLNATEKAAIDRLVQAFEDAAEPYDSCTPTIDGEEAQ